jgi:hypothetical protein
MAGAPEEEEEEEEEEVIPRVAKEGALVQLRPLLPLRPRERKKDKTD